MAGCQSLIPRPSGANKKALHLEGLLVAINAKYQLNFYWLLV